MFDQVTNDILQIQTLLMNKVNNLERERGQQPSFSPRTQYNNKQKQRIN
jgi:hypothetical protein